NPKHADIFYKLGIDVTVSPTKSILSLIEAEIPSSRFVQLMTLKSAGLEIVEVRVPADSPLAGKALRDINLSRSSNIVLLIRDRQPVFPGAETELHAGDDIYALVSREGEEELRKAFGVIE
ncbi:MAG TPA: TrkA C-terminal domain-containing protein, partial [Ktedonobacteraceae bacterium]